LISVGLLTGARLMLWHLAGTTPRLIGYYVKDKSRGELRNVISMASVHLKFLEVPSPTGVSDWDGVAQQLAHLQVDEVIVVSRDNQRGLWIACLRKGLQVTDIAVFIEREYYKIACDEVDLKWILSIDFKWNHPFYHRFKRLMDIAIALIGVVLSVPIFFAAALLIVGQSGFPVLYSQTRVGLRGRNYRLWKLRTMRNDAEAKGPQWAQKQDGRATRIGRILRLTRIDELPQFWNVLRGDMSFIGPRPERPEFVEKLSSLIPLYSQRHWVKPGITGWAQINYPYGASVEDAREKLCYDLYYMKNASLLLDLHIALRTVGAIAKGSR
jgi:exopolysaccharide biosynthesis polyprenyl glycosylphosphotransferase